MPDIPEPSLIQPEDFYVMADCGHEVYEGESLYEWCGKYYCADCFKEEINDLEAVELASLVGSEVQRVANPRYTSC